MKVAIREQIDIEDEQRVHLADILDGKQSKRQATREEIKDFAWAVGSDWDDALAARWTQLFGPEDGEPISSPDVAPADEAQQVLLAVEETDAEEDLLGLADMSADEAMEALL